LSSYRNFSRRNRHVPTNRRPSERAPALGASLRPVTFRARLAILTANALYCAP
jgi:hypothetical protein